MGWNVLTFFIVGREEASENNGVRDEASKYLLDDVSGYMRLKSVALTVETLLCWCVAMVLPKVLVSDTARNFKNRAL